MNQNSQNSMMPPNQQQQQQYNQASQEAQMAQYNSSIYNAWMTYGYSYNMPVAGSMGTNYMQYPQAYSQGYPAGYAGQMMNSTGVANYAAQPGLFPSANPPLPPGNPTDVKGQPRPPTPPPPPPPKPSESGEPTIMKGPKLLVEDIQQALTQNRRSPLPFLEPPPMPPTFPYLAVPSFSLLNDDVENLPTSSPTPFRDTPPSRGIPYVPARDKAPMMHPTEDNMKPSPQQKAYQQHPVTTPVAAGHWNSVGVNPSSVHPLIIQHISPLTCGICKITLNSDGMAKDHYKGKRHAKNVELWLESQPTNSNSSRDNSSLTGANAFPLGSAPKPLMSIHASRPNDSTPQRQNTSKPPVPSNIHRSETFQNGNNKSVPKPAIGNPIKRRISGGPPNVNVLPKKMNLGGSGPRDSKSIPQVIPNQYDYCGLCNAPLGSKNSADQHYAGKRHKEAMARQNSRT